MKLFPVFASSPLVLLGLVGQGSLPNQLTDDFAKLGTAQSLHAAYTLTVGGESQGKYDLRMSRDRLFKLTYPKGFEESDGQNIYTYTKATNTYTKTPLTDKSLQGFLHRPEVFGWAPFFEKTPAAHAQAAQLGQSHSLDGNQVQDVSYTVAPSNDSATVSVDQELGIARGFRLERGKSYVAQADELTISGQPDKADKYAFVAPDGATEAPEGPTYAQVQDLLTNNCMPCHNSTNQRAGLDLTNYNGVMGAVTAGKSADSLIVKALRGTGGADLMPRGRAPLTEDNINLVEKWIDNGAKNQ